MSPVYEDVLHPLTASLAVSVELEDSSLVFRNPAARLVHHDIVKVDDELMLVRRGFRPPNRPNAYLIADVERGYAGTTPTTHLAGATAQIVGVAHI